LKEYQVIKKEKEVDVLLGCRGPGLKSIYIDKD